VANNIITVKSEKDLVGFLENIDNLQYLESNQFKLDGTLFTLRLEGEAFESSLTGGLILGLAKYQEKIYRIFLEGKYGVGTRHKITPEEAKLLEIKVTVKQGSTEVLVKLLVEKVGEVLNRVPPEQIPFVLLGVAGIAAVAFCLKGIGSVAIKEIFKTKRKTISQKRKASKDELEKKKLEFLESSLNTAIEGMRAVSAGIVQANPDHVLIDGKNVSTKEIASVARELEPEKTDVREEQSVITGTYRIQRVTLDFKRDSASADVFDVNTGDPINGIIVQPKHLSDGSYRVLKTAQDKNDVKLQLIVTKRNDIIHKAVLDKIINN